MITTLTDAELRCESARETLLPFLGDLQRTASNGDLHEFQSVAEEAADRLLMLADACEALEPQLAESGSLLRYEPEHHGRELRHIRLDLQRIGRHACSTDEPEEPEESLARWHRTFETWDRSFRELLQSVRQDCGPEGLDGL